MIRLYLRAIAALALECADNPELLGSFIEIIGLAPQTIIELARERKRVAA